MSEFDFGFGSAIADKILADKEYEESGFIQQSITDAATKVKIAVRELILSFENAVRERNDKIQQIRALPEGQYKTAKIEEFRSVDEGGWFTPSFATQVSAMSNLLEKLGLDANPPELETLGFIPLAALAAVPTSAWVAGTTLTVAIAGLATYFATQASRYIAIGVIGADAIEQADPTLPALIGKDLGAGLKIGLVVASLGVVAYLVLKARTGAVK